MSEPSKKVDLSWQCDYCKKCFSPRIEDVLNEIALHETPIQVTIWRNGLNLTGNICFTCAGNNVELLDELKPLDVTNKQK